MLSRSAQTPFAGEIADMDTLHDIMKFMPFNRRSLTAMRCVSKPFRSAVQSPCSPWAPHKEVILSKFGQCVIFNAQEDEEGVSNFSLYSVSPIGRKFRTQSAKVLGRYHALVANGLRKLALHYAQVDNGFFEPLSALVNLRELELVSCRSLTSLSEATRLKNLEVLEVAFCPLETNGVADLRLPSLRRLSLRSCSNLSNLDNVHDDTIASLEELHIQNCGVYDDTSSVFFSKLSGKLRICHLSGTVIDTALGFIPVEALQSLTSLDLSNTPVHTETLQSISTSMRDRLEFLSLENCGELDGLRPIGNLAALRFLDLSKVATLRDKDAVSRCPKLEMFRAAFTELDSTICLSGLEKLRIIDVASTSLTDYGLIHIDHSPELDTVVLTGCMYITSINAFHSCPKIRRIFAANTAITNEGLSLLKDCATLEELDLKQTNVTNVSVLQDCASLKTVNVVGSVPTMDGVQGLIDKGTVEVICDSFEGDDECADD